MGANAKLCPFFAARHVLLEWFIPGMFFAFWTDDYTEVLGGFGELHLPDDIPVVLLNLRSTKSGVVRDVVQHLFP